MGNDRELKQKRSVYFPQGMKDEIQTEAARQGRSFSWIVQRAWRVARKTIKSMPEDPSIEDEEND